MTSPALQLEPLAYAEPDLSGASSVMACPPPRAERPMERRIYALLAACVVVGFFLANLLYWVPAHPGVDQNGYLVGGRMLAENLTMRQSPVRPGSSEFDPHQFVGQMWVGADLGTPQERYYPKYPIGLPFLYAIALWIGGESFGPWLAYLISPIAMTIGVAATYLLVRRVAGSFWGLCGTLVFATSPVVSSLATNPNSHATAVCCAAAGMCLLFSWWQNRGSWRALFAGILLGYACTIRYTEGLLVLPLFIVVIFNLRWRERRSWLESFWALAGWAIPIAILVAYNLAAMGRITGYDGTNESEGFRLQYAIDNWETALRQLDANGLYFIFPFAVVGLAAMLWKNWRIGAVLAAWIIPSIITYIFYYWAPDPPNTMPVLVSYMRFFVTIFPGLVMCAFWLFDQVGQSLAAHTRSPWAFRIGQICCGLITLMSLAVHLQNATFAAETDQVSRLMLKSNCDEVLSAAPPGSVIFSQDASIFHNLQFLRDYSLYTAQSFNKAYIDNLPKVDVDEPQGLEPGRREAMYERLKGLTQQQLSESQRKIMTDAIAAGLRVFFLVPRRDNDPPAHVRFTDEKPPAFPGANWVRSLAVRDKFDIEIASAWVTTIARPWSNTPTTRSQRRRVEVRLDRSKTMWQLVEVFERTAPPAAPPAKPAAPAPARGAPANRRGGTPAAAVAPVPAPARSAAASKPIPPPKPQPGPAPLPATQPHLIPQATTQPRPASRPTTQPPATTRSAK